MQQETPEQSAEQVRCSRAGKSLCERETQGCDPLKSKPVSFRADFSCLAESIRHRGVQLTSLSGIQRGGQIGANGCTERYGPTPARSPQPPARSLRPTSIQPSLPHRPSSLNADHKWILLPPAEPHVGTQDDHPHGTRDPSFRGQDPGGRPGEGASQRVRVPSAPAAAGTDRTARPSGLRLFTARAEGRRLRDGFGLDSTEGKGGQEPDDWARTARHRFEGGNSDRQFRRRGQHCLGPGGKPSRCS